MESDCTLRFGFNALIKSISYTNVSGPAKAFQSAKEMQKQIWLLSVRNAFYKSVKAKS